EYAPTNPPYNQRSIAIEMVYSGLQFPNKEAVPEAQWQATIQLTLNLMQQYNIPLSPHGADWVSPTCSQNEEMSSGVYGHYQVCATSHQDPGPVMFASFLEDLRNGGAGTGAILSGAGGRIVPYDAYARPYSWPINGTIT